MGTHLVLWRQPQRCLDLALQLLCVRRLLLVHLLCRGREQTNQGA